MFSNPVLLTAYRTYPFHVISTLSDQDLAATHLAIWPDYTSAQKSKSDLNTTPIVNSRSKDCIVQRYRSSSSAIGEPRTFREDDLMYKDLLIVNGRELYHE